MLSARRRLGCAWLSPKQREREYPRSPLGKLQRTCLPRSPNGLIATKFRPCPWPCQTESSFLPYPLRGRAVSPPDGAPSKHCAALDSVEEVAHGQTKASRPFPDTCHSLCATDRDRRGCGGVRNAVVRGIGRNARKLQNMPRVQSRMSPGAFEAGMQE